MENNKISIIPKTEAVTAALMIGDLSKLSDYDKLMHYKKVCELVGLNPYTMPFQYMTLNNKEVLYAGKNCAEQLRSIHKISIEIVGREIKEDIYCVVARAKMPDGRVDESIAAVQIAKPNVNQNTGAVTYLPMAGEAKANQIMKCETKAKRRVTLSICGLNMLDESEMDTIPSNVKKELTNVAQIVAPQLTATEEKERPWKKKSSEVVQEDLTVAPAPQLTDEQQLIAKAREKISQVAEFLHIDKTKEHKNLLGILKQVLEARPSLDSVEDTVLFLMNKTYLYLAEEGL